ncbi:unnamed protein product [Pleuronectes platessa]|uniref:Uncharacterized protein n=1 Tax=Pleuronectes platessa TaxID=8262 RepID=A0A9N7W468_PLEPL|nr:unnamed protein product [Pleuronectes platessa]
MNVHKSKGHSPRVILKSGHYVEYMDAIQEEKESMVNGIHLATFASSFHSILHCHDLLFQSARSLGPHPGRVHS